MAYDKNGNFDYEAATMEQRLRPVGRRAAKRASDAFGCLKVAATIVAILGLAVGLVCGAAYGCLYGAGRAVEAGARDARDAKGR